MGDPLQWVGLLSILAVSAAIVRVARRSPNAAVAPAAASRPRENSVIDLERTLRPEVVGFSHLRSMLTLSSQAHSTAASTWMRVESKTGADAS